jgi:hypothetical protein
VRQDRRVIETLDVRKLQNRFSVVECCITWAGFPLLLNDKVGIGGLVRNGVRMLFRVKF